MKVLALLIVIASCATGCASINIKLTCRNSEYEYKYLGTIIVHESNVPSQCQ